MEKIYKYYKLTDRDIDREENEVVERTDKTAIICRNDGKITTRRLLLKSLDKVSQSNELFTENSDWEYALGLYKKKFERDLAAAKRRVKKIESIIARIDARMNGVISLEELNEVLKGIKSAKE